MAAVFTPNATNLEGQVFESIQKLQELELAYNILNPDTPLNNAQIALDSEANQVTLSVTLPVTIAVSTGGLTVTAQAYV